MNRIDRLFATLLLLQSEKRIRAYDLAARFEISKRTVYRDIAALSEMGVPIVSLPGEGYELMPDFYLPPLVFTPDEASVLFLGAHMLRQHAEGRFSDAAGQALAKLTAVLPTRICSQVERLSEIIQFIQPDGRFNLDDPRLVILQQAVLEQKLVHIQYHSYSRNEITERMVEPYQLFYNNGIWYFNGFCRLRGQMREFRLDRIDGLRLQRETFARRPIAVETAETITVLVRFAIESARWVREQQHYTFSYEETTVNGIIMTYIVQQLQEIIPWLRRWGAAAEVLSPPQLRQQLRQEAKQVVKMLT